MTTQQSAGNRAIDAYLRQSVLTAGPVKIVKLLLEKATNSTRRARVAIERHQTRETGEALSRVFAIITELRDALDHERGGDIAPELDRLYGFVLSRLSEANRQRTVGPLDDALVVLERLTEAWDALART